MKRPRSFGWQARVAAALFVAALGAGCGTASTSCTLLACSDGVTVSFALAATLPYFVTLDLDGQAASFTCDTPGPYVPTGGVVVERCDARGFFLHGAPASLGVTVDSAGAKRMATLHPAYATSRPNGPTCPPVCRQATVTLP